MTVLKIAAVVAVALIAGAAHAHDYTAGDLKIDHPWSRATAPGAKVAGGFLKITNNGASPDRLVAVSAPFAQKAEIHESLEEDGVAKMRQIDGGVALKPGDTVEFAPGGKHLMFIGLSEPLATGKKVKGELTFEKAGKVEVEFAIEPAGSKPAANGEHKH